MLPARLTVLSAALVGCFLAPQAGAAKTTPSTLWPSGPLASWGRYPKE